MSATATARVHSVSPVVAVVLAWLVPGAGHFALGRRQKGLIFLLSLPTMFGLGLLLSGRVFPFDLTQPLGTLAAVAARGLGAPALLAGLLGLGQGVVTAASYEYGNTFLIVAGLLNMLVALDAYDVAAGRK